MGVFVDVSNALFAEHGSHDLHDHHGGHQHSYPSDGGGGTPAALHPPVHRASSSRQTTKHTTSFVDSLLQNGLLKGFTNQFGTAVKPPGGGGQYEDSGPADNTSTRTASLVPSTSSKHHRTAFRGEVFAGPSGAPPNTEAMAKLALEAERHAAEKTGSPETFPKLEENAATIANLPSNPKLAVDLLNNNNSQ